jgi:hypothetical protein
LAFAEKDFNYYWGIVSVPFYILLGWLLLGLILSLVHMDTYRLIFNNWATFVLGIAFFGFIGWTTVKDHKGEVKHAAWAGAIFGAFLGLAGAVVSILMLNLSPAMLEMTIQQGMARVPPEAGMGRDMMQSYIMMGMYIGLITGPLFNGLIGALVSGISGAVSKKVR